jgi:hypothetical protein
MPLRFKAFKGTPKGRPLVVVDLGYSARRSSCGVTWTGRGTATNHRFRVAVIKVKQALAELRRQDPILVLEAPLSGCHNDRENPMARGPFEQGRGWYCQPAASVCLGALRLLQVLAEDPPPDLEVLWLAEAFLSNKSDRTGHADDAAAILTDFWSAEVASLWPRTHPTFAGLESVPNVYIFNGPSSGADGD